MWRHLIYNLEMCVFMLYASWCFRDHLWLHSKFRRACLWYSRRVVGLRLKEPASTIVCSMAPGDEKHERNQDEHDGAQHKWFVLRPRKRP